MKKIVTGLEAVANSAIKNKKTTSREMIDSQKKLEDTMERDREAPNAAHK